jgi:MscS family membrane protein
MSFLDEIYFDNSVRNYLVIIGAILVAILLKKILSKYIASILYRLFKSSAGNIDKKHFINLVIDPLQIFLVLVVSVLAIDELNFPSRLNVRVYHSSTKQIVESIIIGVIIISLIWIALRLIDFIALMLQIKGDKKSVKAESQLVLFFRDFLKVIIIILGGVVTLKFCFNAHIGQLITGLSIVGAALALAAKESLENLIASFIIFFDKPFGAGDLVRINNYQGFVERIGLRSTRIRTIEKTVVTVPNKQMVDSILDNWSMRNEIRNELRIELAPQTSAQKIEAAVSEIKKILESRSVLISASSVYLIEVTKNAALIIAEYFTDYSLSINDLNKLKEDINLEIKRMQEQNNILSSVANSFTFITPSTSEETKQP